MLFPRLYRDIKRFYSILGYIAINYHWEIKRWVTGSIPDEVIEIFLA